MKNKFIMTISALLLTSCLVICLSACGGNSTSNSSTESESAETETVSAEETDEAIDSADSNTEEIAEEEPAADLNNNGDPKLSAGDTREYWLDYENTFKVYCPAGFYEPEVWAGANMSGDEAKGHMKKFEWFYIGESGNTNDYINCPRVSYELGGGLFGMIEGTTKEVTYGSRTYKCKEQDNGIYIAPNIDFSIENFCIIPNGGEIPEDVITEILESLPMEE